MKVVSVMTSAARGGAEFAAVDMLAALGARGHDVVMLTNQPELVDGRGVRARRIDLGPKLSRSTYRGLVARWPAIAWALARELAREAPYDVLIVHFKKEQLLAATLPRRLRPLLAWAEWGPVPGPLRSGLARRAYVAAARRADLVMAVSEGTRESLRDAGVPSRLVHVVPNALPVESRRFSADARHRIRAEHQIPPEAPVVGLISRFHPRKRNDVAVDAVIGLGREDVHLIMAGEGETEPDLRRRSQPLGRRAHFLPNPGSAVADVCSSFDVTVFCPSPTEGAPLAVINSMLAARPVVATAAEGVRGMIIPGAGTIISPEHDPAALTKVLRAYLADGARRAREGEAARAHAEKVYAAEAVAVQIERLLAPDGIPAYRRTDRGKRQAPRPEKSAM